MSDAAPGPPPQRPAFCPQCRGRMGLTDAKCPHCGYDFPAPEGQSFLPVWIVLGLVALVIVIHQLGFGQLLDIALLVLFLASLIGAGWRLWIRFRDTR